ncbi:MAG: hypothetical protein WCW65_02705 [Candidatus Paceibacterota bacterium]
MTKDNAKDFIPIVKAIAEGKTIQLRNGSNWHNIGDTNISLIHSPEAYRIKPENTDEEIAELKKAYAAGKKIEYLGSLGWTSACPPFWSPDTKYRLAPGQEKDSNPMLCEHDFGGSISGGNCSKCGISNRDYMIYTQSHSPQCFPECKHEYEVKDKNDPPGYFCSFCGKELTKRAEPIPLSHEDILRGWFRYCLDHSWVKVIAYNRGYYTLHGFGRQTAEELCSKFEYSETPPKE